MTDSSQRKELWECHILKKPSIFDCLAEHYDRYLISAIIAHNWVKCLSACDGLGLISCNTHMMSLHHWDVILVYYLDNKSQNI